MKLRDAEAGLDAIIRELNAVTFDKDQRASIVWDGEVWCVCLIGSGWTTGLAGESLGEVCLRARRDARLKVVPTDHVAEVA